MPGFFVFLPIFKMKDMELIWLFLKLVYWSCFLISVNIMEDILYFNQMFILFEVREREFIHLLIHSIKRCYGWVGAGQARCQELHLGLLCGLGGPGTWTLFCCFSKSITRELDVRWSSSPRWWTGLILSVSPWRLRSNDYTPTPRVHIFHLKLYITTNPGQSRLENGIF